MAEQRFRVAVVMQRLALANRWVDETWLPVAVLADPTECSGEPVQLANDADRSLWSWPGFALQIHPSEAEGYWLNTGAPEPRVFVEWRNDEGRAVPTMVTVSYNEAARWLDGGAQVDGVPMPPEILAWLADWVARNYRPEPRKKVRRNDPFRDGAFRRERR